MGDPLCFLSLRWERIPIETDCLTAIKLIITYRVLIEDCRELIKDMIMEVVHVLNEANKCADNLAKIGEEQGERLVRMLMPLDELIDNMKADQRGTAFERGM